MDDSRTPRWIRLAGRFDVRRRIRPVCRRLTPPKRLSHQHSKASVGNYTVTMCRVNKLLGRR
jgi:hypothetical protein